MEEKSKNKTTERLKTVLIIILTIIVILLLLVRCTGIGSKSNDGDEITNTVQTNEKINEMTAEEKQEYVNKIVEDSMININFVPYATFDENGHSTQFKVTNIEQNHDAIKFTLYDENDEVIYESSEIAQGYECSEITLSKPLSKGEHIGSIIIGYVGGGSVSSSFPITMVVE